MWMPGQYEEVAEEFVGAKRVEEERIRELKRVKRPSYTIHSSQKSSSTSLPLLPSRRNDIATELNSHKQFFLTNVAVLCCSG